MYKFISAQSLIAVHKRMHTHPNAHRYTEKNTRKTSDEKALLTLRGPLAQQKSNEDVIRRISIAGSGQPRLHTHTHMHTQTLPRAKSTCAFGVCARVYIEESREIKSRWCGSVYPYMHRERARATGGLSARTCPGNHNGGRAPERNAALIRNKCPERPAAVSPRARGGLYIHICVHATSTRENWSQENERRVICAELTVLERSLVVVVRV